MHSTDIVRQSIGNANSAPTVSIIMPSYRVAEYIGAALDSVLAQTFTDYEIIVINDGSPDTDELEIVLEPYRDHIVYIKQENRGVSSARNTGVRAARGPLIAQLDPDDMWEPEYLAVQVAAMERDPTIDVLYPNALIFGDTPNAGRTFMDVWSSEGEVSFERLITQQCNVLYSATMRRETVIRAGMFDESLRGAEDFDLWLRISKGGGRIAYHRQVLVRHRRRGGSLSSDPIQMLKCTLQILEKLERTFDLTPAERETLQQGRTRFHAMLHFSEGKKAFYDGDMEAAISGLTEANTFFRSRKTALVLLLLRLAPRLLLRAYDLRDRFVLRMGTRY